MSLKELIENKLQHIPTNLIPEEWETIPNDKKLALFEFYNTVESSLDEDDLQILADLYHGVSGSISWIDCEECHEEHCIALPNNWSAFQGVNCSNEANHLQECCVKTLSE